jgi:hypothetical protein
MSIISTGTFRLCINKLFKIILIISEYTKIFNFIIGYLYYLYHHLDLLLITKYLKILS